MYKRQKKKVVQQKETTKLKRRMIEKVLSKTKSSNGAFNLDLLVDGWLELESDPGTFSLLIEDFGCFGAQVEEVYDLEQKFDGPVFGFIFLFKWLNNQQNDNHRSRNNQKLALDQTNPACSKVDSRQQHQSENNNGPQQNDDRQWSYVEDENILNEIFFAKQMISNSCATHALVSILLNCDHDELNLGPTLSRLKEHTKIMNPENKGHAIGNVPELAKAHNSHASYSSLYSRNRPSSQARGMSFMIRGNQRTNLQQQNQPETYHFVSYVPVNNRLYELDGLKNFPIDHGSFGSKEDWTEKFRSVIKQRLLDNKSGDDSTMSSDIRYNLMAVVPDKRVCLKAQVKKIKCHLKSVQKSIRQLSRKLNESTKSTSTTETHEQSLNPPHSPISNGTLTASESGSTCNSPKSHPYELEHNSSSLQTDTEIPRPPYSPLSTATLTASESGSVNNTPASLEDSFFYDDDVKVEKYFFIKFGQQADEPTTTTSITSTTTDMKASKVSSETTIHPPPLIQRAPRSMKEEKLLAIENLRRLSAQLSAEIDKLEVSLKEENDKRRKHKLDNSRRTHNYEPFIMTFLSMLAKQGNLADLIEKDLGVVSETAETTPATPVAEKRAQTQPAPSNKQAQTPRALVVQPKGKLKPQNRVEDKPQKPRYRYVSTGRPRGRPRKNPQVT